MSEEETPKTKLAKDLRPGDVVVTGQGETVKITKVAKGVYVNSTYIEWKGGWTNQPNGDEIEVK